MKSVKRIIFYLSTLFLLLSIPNYAQTIKFTKKTGFRTSEVIYKISKDGNVTNLFIQIGTQKSYHRIDSDNQTVFWRIVDSSKDFDMSITREGNRYHLCGVTKGKSVDKYESGRGLPWYQNLAYICGRTVSPGEVVRYECFRPGEFSLVTMEARTVKCHDLDGICVRATPVGVKKKLWHADYYYSPEDGSLTGYKSVEGGPGTPVTTWKRK